MSDANQTSKEFINKERREILHQIDTWLEIPMIGLSLVWTVLLIIEFVWGLNSFLNGVSNSKRDSQPLCRSKSSQLKFRFFHTD